MFKFGKVGALFIASIGSILIVSLISKITGLNDPALEKVWVAFLSTSIMAQMVIKA